MQQRRGTAPQGTGRQYGPAAGRQAQPEARTLRRAFPPQCSQCTMAPEQWLASGLRPARWARGARLAARAASSRLITASRTRATRISPGMEAPAGAARHAWGGRGVGPRRRPRHSGRAARGAASRRCSDAARPLRASRPRTCQQREVGGIRRQGPARAQLPRAMQPERGGDAHAQRMRDGTALAAQRGWQQQPCTQQRQQNADSRRRRAGGRHAAGCPGSLRRLILLLPLAELFAVAGAAAAWHELRWLPPLLLGRRGRQRVKAGGRLGLRRQGSQHLKHRELRCPCCAAVQRHRGRRRALPPPFRGPPADGLDGGVGQAVAQAAAGAGRIGKCSMAAWSVRMVCELRLRRDRRRLRWRPAACRLQPPPSAPPPMPRVLGQLGKGASSCQPAGRRLCPLRPPPAELRVQGAVPKQARRQVGADGG